MFTSILYGAALILLVLSWKKSPQKTRQSLKKAWRSCTGVLPLFFAILLCMGFLLSFVDESAIQQVVGRESGMVGIALNKEELLKINKQLNRIRKPKTKS